MSPRLSLLLTLLLCLSCGRGGTPATPAAEAGNPLGEPVARPQADTSGLDIFLPSETILDQKESGRCWYFATLNALRDDIRFSSVYGYYWDMVEKAGLFLSEVYEHRIEPLDSRTNEILFRRPTWDGGHIMNAAYLIEKYGVVPEEAMPETPASGDTAPLLQTLRTLLRRYGLRIREAADPEAVREQALSDVRRLLTALLGTPPERFSYEGKEYTPQSFRAETIPADFPDGYAVLMNDPTRPYGLTYRVEGSRNAADGTDWTFLNLPLEDLEQAGIAALSKGVRFYFTVDTNRDGLPTEGVYDSSLFPVDSLYGISSAMTREERFLTRDISSAHAMAMCGVRLAPDGSPSEWVSENSFGLRRGAGGHVTMTAEWWRTYMFRMALPARFLPPKTRALLTQEPLPIPRWNLY